MDFLGRGNGILCGRSAPFKLEVRSLVKKESLGLKAERRQSAQQPAGQEKPVIIEILWVGRNHDLPV